MMNLHDKTGGMKNVSVLTRRGQVSLPASLRRSMRLQSGQKLRWERISDRECRVIVEEERATGALAALGYGPRLRGDAGRRTGDWLAELREGD